MLATRSRGVVTGTPGYVQVRYHDTVDIVAKTVRLPGELAERLRVIAFQRRASQSSIIIRAVQAEVDRLEGEGQ